MEDLHDSPNIKNRIKATAQVTDKLIGRLDSLATRLDAAKKGDNQELAEYYERQFIDTSVEFMNGVETILDGWYELKGVPRPPADEEIISEDELDEIHGTVVSILHGTEIPDPLIHDAEFRKDGEGSANEPLSPKEFPPASSARTDTPPPKKKSGVDVTG
ncbi:hypothetical protein FACS1894216_11080 [Synergistales bacterium]|nr:hypothetical protein FACS1894216_11080 [Synergistales bacterium]